MPGKKMALNEDPLREGADKEAAWVLRAEADVLGRSEGLSDSERPATAWRSGRACAQSERRMRRSSGFSRLPRSSVQGGLM